MKTKTDLVLLRSFSDEQEAYIIKGKLEAENISVQVRSINAGGAYPSPLSPTPRPFKLFVDKKDYQKATELL